MKNKHSKSSHIGEHDILTIIFINSRGPTRHTRLLPTLLAAYKSGPLFNNPR